MSFKPRFESLTQQVAVSSDYTDYITSNTLILYLMQMNNKERQSPSADVTAARIILSGCILSCSGVDPTDVIVTVGWPEDVVSVCGGLMAI